MYDPDSQIKDWHRTHGYNTNAMADTNGRLEICVSFKAVLCLSFDDVICISQIDLAGCSLSNLASLYPHCRVHIKKFVCSLVAAVWITCGRRLQITTFQSIQSLMTLMDLECMQSHLQVSCFAVFFSCFSCKNAFFWRTTLAPMFSLTFL